MRMTTIMKLVMAMTNQCDYDVDDGFGDGDGDDDDDDDGEFPSILLSLLWLSL